MHKCSHCQNSYPHSLLKHIQSNGEDLYFCCNGCESVYFLLQSYGIESFYQKLQNQTLTPPKRTNSLPLEYYDSEAFTQKYIKEKQEISEITLLIHHIHCSACIWLNEVMIGKLEGIKEISINYTNHKAHIVFDREKIKLSEIVRLIVELGYDVSVGEQMQLKANEERRSFLLKLVVAIFCTMNIMWVAIAQYSGYFQGIEKEYSLLLNIASLILCTPVVFYSGSLFYKNAYFSLKKGFVGMDLLVFTGSSLTYLYSIFALFNGYETYFESVSMILTFVLIGKFLENYYKHSAGEVLQSLQNQIPKNVRVLREGVICEVTPQEVQIGEVVEVFVGERISIDGELISQKGVFDEVALSGESEPVEKKSGERIVSGSINLMQNIFYKTIRSFEDSTLNTLIKLIENASCKKPKIEMFANAISARFSQIVLFIAGVSFGVHWLIGEEFAYALSVGISVIIIACPCALALATPISSIVGLSKAYENAILFKQSQYLESLAKVDFVCFDKTGTLTQGSPKVVNEIRFCEYDLGLLQSFMSKNIHPIAYGICEYIAKEEKREIEEFRVFEFQGVESKYQEKILLGGSLEFIQSRGISIPEIELGEGSVFAYCVGGELMSVFVLQDEIKSHAKETLQELQKMGIGYCILSGDRESEVRRIAKALEIEEFYFALDPMQKAKIVEGLRGRGKKIAMVGDGINDVLALTQSEVGISFANRNDLAVQSSDIVLLKDEFMLLSKTFKIAKITLKNIKENIGFSLLYNSTTIPLAVLGYIIPLFAALSMSVSSLIVVFNALRIKKMDL